MSDFSYLNIEKAYEKMIDNVVKTPLITNDFINQLLDTKTSLIRKLPKYKLNL